MLLRFWYNGFVPSIFSVYDGFDLAPSMLQVRQRMDMRILLADSDSRVRSALGVLLMCDHEFRIVGESDNADDLLVDTLQLAPDLVLLDWELPGTLDGSLIERLRRLRPEVKILVLSCRPEAREPAVHAGADGFVSKVDPAEYLLSDMRALLAPAPTVRAPGNVVA